MSTLLYGDSFRSPNIFYVTGFLVPDPVVYLKHRDHTTLVVSTLEASRAEKEARVDEVKTFDDLGYRQSLDQGKDASAAMGDVMERLLGETGARSFTVEPAFPVYYADRLRSAGLELLPDPELLTSERRIKSETEIEAVSRAQARAERALADAIEILAESDVRDGGVVYRGVPLTSERLRAEVEVSLIKDGFVSDALIVAPGPRSSDPHWIGSGPVRAQEPIILDFFPQDRASRFHGDVTRTLIKGEAPTELVRMHEAVFKAQATALDMIGPGVSGRRVHEAVVASFESDGYDEHSRARYIHGTGHGLGLEVHEAPRISWSDVELAEGDVVTVEPGLYDPDLGGVRIEDVVVVTSGGNRNLSSLPKNLVVP